MNNPGYLRFVAKYILRLHRYYTETFPLVILIPLLGFFVGAMASASDVALDAHRTYWEWFGHASILAAKITLTFKVISYLIWEIYQGWKSLKHWATHYGKK